MSIFLYANHSLFYTFIIIIVSVTIHFLISPLFPVNNSYLNLWSLPFVSLTLSLEGLVRGEQLGGASLPAELKPWHKPKCKALRGSGQSLVPIQARQRLDWQEPRGEALEDVGWQKTQYVSSQHRRKIIFWAVSKAAWPEGGGRWLTHSLSWDPIWSTWLQHKDIDLLEWVQRRITKIIRKIGHFCGKAERIWIVYLREETALRRPYSSLLVPKGANRIAGERLLTNGCSDKTRGSGFKLKEGRE